MGKYPAAVLKENKTTSRANKKNTGTQVCQYTNVEESKVDVNTLEQNHLGYDCSTSPQLKG